MLRPARLQRARSSGDGQGMRTVAMWPYNEGRTDPHDHNGWGQTGT